MTAPAPMSDERMREIEARLAAATPGPWCAAHAGVGDRDGRFRVTEWLVRRPGDDVAIACDIAEPHPQQHIISQANAEFIAHAPADIAALLADNKRLREAITDITSGRKLSELHDVGKIIDRLRAAIGEEDAP